MAYGDIGGTVTELIVTCQTKSDGTVAIKKGDAVALTGNYVVEHAAAADDAIFGEALAAADSNGAPLPVNLRGISAFAYTGAAPTVNGVAGITLSATAGKVKAPASGNGQGVNVKVDSASGIVHVLL